MDATRHAAVRLALAGKVSIEQKKEQMHEERQRIRETLKLKFEEFCEKNGVGGLTGLGAAMRGSKAVPRWAAAC